jgi:hypothetical protein
VSYLEEKDGKEGKLRGAANGINGT